MSEDRVSGDRVSVPSPEELAALAARLGFHVDTEIVDVMRAAVEASEPAVARLRARPLPSDGAADPAHGDVWLRRWSGSAPLRGRCP